MKKGNKEFLVVGDRLLIVPDVGEDRSATGLYLPKWAVEKESVQGGRIVEVGPGFPLPSPGDVEDEPWKAQELNQRHVPMQAQIGDYAIFIRKAAIEVKIEADSFLIVPHGALLLLMRGDENDPKRV